MSYMETLGMMSPTAGGAKRAADLVAALVPPSQVAGADMPSTSLTRPTPKAPEKSAPRQLLSWAPGLAGAAVGVLAWKNHRVLGALVGHAVGSNAVALVKGGDERKKALYRLGLEGAAVAGALVCSSKEHPYLYPVLGYVAGGVLGSMVEAFIPGSPVREAYDKWRAKSG